MGTRSSSSSLLLLLAHIVSKGSTLLRLLLEHLLQGLLLETPGLLPSEGEVQGSWRGEDLASAR